MTLVLHVLLVASLLAIGAAALRAASALAPQGLERVLVAAVLGAAAIVVETLALGIFALGSSPVVIALVAGATWLAVRALLPAPAVKPLDELVDAIATAPPAFRLAVGAFAGVLAALVVFFLRHPAVGIDGTAYHLPEIVNWIHSGRFGAEIHPSEDFPTGAYPLTNEMLLAWSMGLTHSFVAVALLPPAMLALLATAGWAGLRRLGVAAAVAALTIVAVLVSPPLVGALNAPKNDLAALTWLVMAATLCVAALKRPPLLAVAVLAGGLSIGTKTTTAPLVVVVLGVALWFSWRRGTPPLPSRNVLAVALLGAAAVGGVWYVRNLVVHGSPLWPLLSTPWGDDPPAALGRLTPSFFDRPLQSLEGRTGAYTDGLSGGLILMFGGMLAWSMTRSRAVLVASAATFIAVLAWARAPYTGIANDRYVDLSLFVIRYLMPAVTVGAAALALSSRVGGARSVVAVALLGAAALWSGYNTIDIGYPLVASPAMLAAGAIGGAVAALAVQWTAARGVPLLRIAGGLATAIVAVGLAVAAPGYIERHENTHATFATPIIKWFMGQKDFKEGDATMYLSPQAIGPLAGNELQHDIKLIPGKTPCREVIARAREGYVVIRDLPALSRSYLAPYQTDKCLAGQPKLYRGKDFSVYRLAPGG